MSYRIGFIGTGATPDNPTKEGFAMAYRHAGGYQRLADCDLVACADIVRENAQQFADSFDVGGVYEDYRAMLDAEDLDIVSVCVPPDVHADIVRGCAEHGGLEAVHCEKPMATTWKDCREMAEACDRAGIKLTFNHQRRTAPVYTRPKELLEAGKIGTLRRIEWSAENLFDSGTHMFHLSSYYADQAPVEWVLSGLDYSEENLHFGVHNENQAVTKWRYENGVYGLAVTGRSSDALDARIRLTGTEGAIEVGASEGPPLRVRNGRTLGWKTVDVGEDTWGNRAYATVPGYVRWGLEVATERLAAALPGVADPGTQPSHTDRAIASVVDAVRTDEESVLSWRGALDSTETIFAAWESARRRGRVELPLDVDENPLEMMIENGTLAVVSGQA
jgi:predicted dehydrogenase